MMDSIILRIVIFVLLSVFFIVISRNALRNRNSHGFYRFFAFEGIAVLVLYNHPVWFIDPFTLQQCLSWLVLLTSLSLAVRGVVLLKKIGGQCHRDSNPENLSFENTENLVNDGLYGYIRHPMYTSLLLLALGALLKQVNLITFSVFLVVATAVFLTARVEEKENIAYFGDEYLRYKSKSKMFIPFII